MSGLGGMVAQGGTAMLCCRWHSLMCAGGLILEPAPKGVIGCNTHRLLDVHVSECLNAGMALGTGSAMAHAAIDRVFSSKHPEPAEAAQAAQQIAASPQVCFTSILSGQTAASWRLQW